VPDAIFANPRLAAIYDAVDSDRSDLDHYLRIVEEFGATTILDVGCGTGTLACLLSERGLDVVGVDPAEASLDVARGKPGANDVRWVSGDATTLPPLSIDMALMTGNVAQVFLDDANWRTTLAGIAAAVGESGTLVFETRQPALRDWERWTRDQSQRRVDIPLVGVVETWVELTDVSLPLVSFRHTYRFESDHAVLTSDSTLRFRNIEEVTSSLADTGWHLDETRDAPDRPGKEYVCIASRQNDR